MYDLLVIRAFIRTGLLIVPFLLLLSQAHGAAGDADLSFDPGSGLDGMVGALALQPDGKVIIAGAFTEVRGLARTGLARLNADGSGDSSFVPATGGSACVLVQPDGKVLAGSVRLNADGSLDTGFNVPVISDYDSISHGPQTMALQPDGRILIGGGFRVVNGALRSGIARLNADGSLDTTFIPDTSDNFYAAVYSIVLQPDGKILIGGQSMTVDDASIVRLNADGSRDVSFNAGPDDPVWGVGLQPDGKVLIGGTFENVNGAARNGIARLHANGALDTDFVPGPDASGWAQSFAVQTDGRIVVGRYGTYSRLIRLNANGSVDGTFGNFAGQPSASALAIQPDGKILAGGVGDDQPLTTALIRIKPDGTRDRDFVVGGGVGVIHTLAPQPDGKVLIGGAIGPPASGSIARLNPDGSWDDTFHPAPGIPADGQRIFLQPDGRMLLSGYSSTVDNEGEITSRGEITRLHGDGSLDAGFHTDASVPGGFHLMALQPDGRVLACGGTAVGEIRYLTLVRLNSDGSADGTFQSLLMEVRGLPDINTVAVQADGRVLVGGRFSIGEDPGGYSLVRLNADGTLDATFHHAYQAEGPGLEVRSILLRSDGTILIAGILLGSDGMPADTVRRLNADGSVDRAFDAGPGISIYTATTDGGGIAWQSDGKVIASGYARPEAEEYYNGPIRLNVDGSLDRTFNTGTGFFPGNHCLALQSDGNVLVGGPFLTIRGVFRPHVARLSGDPRPPLSYAAWAAGFGLSGATAAAGADPDHDGIASGVEYIVGGNPAAPDASGRPAVRLSEGNMIFSFSRDDASENPGTHLTVEAGPGLLIWPAAFSVGATTATSSPGVSVTENAAAPDAITVTIPTNQNKTMFARLRVTVAP